MKTMHLFFIALLYFLSLQLCTAQRLAGFYGGINFSDLRIDPEEPTSPQKRLILGGFFARQIGSGVGTRFGVQFIEKGAKMSGVDAKLGYLDMLLSFQAGGFGENGGFYLIGGAGLGILASARGRVPSANVNLKELFQGGELSVHGGLGLRFRALFVEGSYATSLLSVIKEEFDQEAFNKGFQLKAGLSFNLY